MSALLRIAVSFILFATIRAHADDGLQDSFPRRLPVDGVWTTRALCRLEVPLAVFDGSPSFPEGVRLFQPDGQSCPFFVLTPAPRESVANLGTRLLNRSEVAGPDRYARIDLELAAVSGTSRCEHDRITVRMPGTRFFRRVEVLGREDQEAWAAIATGFLVSDDASIRNVTIHYPVSTFPHLQVRVYPDARNAAEPLQFDELSVGRASREPGETLELPLTVAAGQPDAGDARGTQVVELDTGYRHVPLARLRIAVAGGEFARAVVVQGRNAATSEWRYVAAGSLHRIGTQEGRSLELGGADDRFLRLKISNHEDAPLAVTGAVAERVPRHLVFEPPVAGGRLWLCYGSDLAGRPVFDLERRVDATRLAVAIRVRPGPDEANPAFKREGLAHEALIVRVVVGVASAVVIAVIASMLKRSGAKRPE